MENLPPELLRQVCLLLRDDAPPALRALSGVSVLLSRVTAPLLYETAFIRFTDVSSLKAKTAQFTENGLGRPFLVHATSLVLLAVPHRERDRFHGHGGRVRTFESAEYSRTFKHYLPATTGSFMEQYMDRFDLPGYWHPLEEVPGHYAEQQWRPLVDVISRLKHLATLHYAITNAFPTTLLDAIHQYHPDCQLHIWTAQRPTFEIPTTQAGEPAEDWGLERYYRGSPLDPRVLQSPTLTTITVDYPYHVHTDPVVFDPYHLIRVIRQCPSLKNILLRLDDDVNRHRVDRPGPSPQFNADIPPSSNLQSFYIARGGIWEDKIFHAWNERLGFSRLRSLFLPRSYYPSLFKDAAPRLLSLETLFIGVAPDPFSWEQVREELRCTFQNLKPLKHLSIAGLEDVSLLYEILEKHGETLLGLMIEPFHRLPEHRGYHGWVCPYLDGKHLTRVARLCPLLEDLRVPIRRTKGDRVEVSIYRALGAFSRVQNLILDLYGNPRPVVCAEDGWYGEDQLGSNTPCIHVDLEEAFANYAVDRSLAAAIWKEVLGSQKSRSLTRLRVSPWGMDVFDDTATFYVLSDLARSFLVTHGGEDIVEIGGEEIAARRELMITEGGIELPPLRVPRRITRVLHSLWPPKSVTDDWSTTWKSFLLETADA